MLLLDKEFLSSLWLRHRNHSGASLYTSFLGFGENEPFPPFETKAHSIQNAVERFLFHISDQIETKKNLILLLSTTPWVSIANYDYIHSRIKFLLPQSFSNHVFDISTVKGSPGSLLRALMKSCGIERFARNDSGNLKKLFNFISFQWNEYCRKQYFILYRSDCLSFPQIAFLKKLSIFDKTASLPLCYFALEGTTETLFSIRDLRKQPLADDVYGIYFLFHMGSLRTKIENISEKLGKNPNEFVSDTVFKELFYASSNGALFALFHSLLARMYSRRLKKLEKQKDIQEIFSELQKENDEFLARSPEYKAKLEKRDYIFPPELLRDGPSITEARRFFRWMGWER